MERKTGEIVLASGPELGKFLIDTAIEEILSQKRKAVIGHVKDLLKKEEAVRRQLDFFTDSLARIKAQILALEKGEFSLDGEGRIVFKDSKLNI